MQIILTIFFYMAFFFISLFEPIYNPAEKYGVIDNNGKNIIECKYNNIDRQGDYFIAKNGNRYGVISKTGKTIIPCKYSEVEVVNNCFIVKKGNLYGVLNTDNKEITPIKYTILMQLDSGNFYVGILTDERAEKMRKELKKNHFILDKKMFTTRNWLIDRVNLEFINFAEYFYINDFYKYGLLDKSGKVIIPLNYNHGSKVLEYICSNPTDSYSIDYITKCINKYEEVPDFKDGLAIVHKNGKGVLIDKTGKEILHSRYYMVNIYKNVIIADTMPNGNGYSGLIDTKGEEIIPLKYSYISDFKNDFAIVNVEDKNKRRKYGVINIKGQEVLPCVYDDINEYTKGLILIKKNNKLGVVNSNYQEIIPCKYNEIKKISNSLLLVNNHNKWGYLKDKNKEFIPCIYDKASDFSEGLAFVRKDDKYGYINADGKIVIPLIYTSANEFHSGLARVEKNKKVIYINRYGKEIFSLKYSPRDFSNGMLLVKRKSRYGYFDTQGKLVIPYKYYNANNFEDNLTIVSTKNVINIFK